MTGELALLSSAGISLVHGWLIDPGSHEYTAVSHVKYYDPTMNLIVEADVLKRVSLRVLALKTMGTARAPVC
jgi:ubiquitin carboxyl-terminal hydrolase MINDY-1/2